MTREEIEVYRKKLQDAETLLNDISKLDGFISELSNREPVPDSCASREEDIVVRLGLVEVYDDTDDTVTEEMFSVILRSPHAKSIFNHVLMEYRGYLENELAEM